MSISYLYTHYIHMGIYQCHISLSLQHIQRNGYCICIYYIINVYLQYYHRYLYVYLSIVSISIYYLIYYHIYQYVFYLSTIGSYYLYTYGLAIWLSIWQYVLYVCTISIYRIIPCSMGTTDTKWFFIRVERYILSIHTIYSYYRYILVLQRCLSQQ